MFIKILILLIILIIFVIFYEKIVLFLKEDQKFLYKRKDFLLNIPERKFFEELQKIIPNEYVVFPQVLLSSIVKVNSSKKEFWKYQNKINRKTVDFVIFEKQYLKPIVAIEYDGKTHDKNDRKNRDNFINRVLEVSGIKILHIKHQENIDFEVVKTNINNLL